MNRAIYFIFISCLMTLADSSVLKVFGQDVAGQQMPLMKVRYELYGHMKYDSLESERGSAGNRGPYITQALVLMDGFERIHIVNVDSKVLKEVRLKLYPNSYSSDSTFLNEWLLKNNDSRLYFAKSQNLGRLKGLDFKLDGRSMSVEDEKGTGELMHLLLPEPLAPGDSIIIETPFLLKLPKRLIDLGYQDGVSYLKDWFAEPLGQIVNQEKSGTVQIKLQVPNEATCYLADSAFNNVVALPEVETLAGEDEQIFNFCLNMGQTLVIKSADKGDIKEMKPSYGAESHEQYFSKLLPGIFASKRPLHPNKLWEQMQDVNSGKQITKQVQKPLTTTFLFNLKDADTKRYLSLSPAFGYNKYDDLMAGILVHNYGLPTSKINFALAPLYSTTGKTLSGLGHITYTQRQSNNAWQLGLTASDYAINEYSGWIDGDGNEFEGGRMRLLRVVPSIRYKWYPSLQKPSKAWLVGAKAYILNKDNWSVENNELVLAKNTTTIAEVSIGLRDDRLLYPYDLSLKVQATDAFLKAGLTGNYFLGFDAKGNGLKLRGFAGKFFFLKDMDFTSKSNLSSYFFNLSGPTGLQDVTYSDYFIGRAAYSGWMSQQMVASEGFFKVSTPSLAEPVGRTDNWLAAINLTSDLPENINPFAALPFRLPVRIFADFGTYSDLWSETPEAGRFLYDAGLQVSILKEAVTIYLPILYSKIYRDTNNSMEDQKSFARKIRFSISLENLLPKRLSKEYKW